MPRKLFFHVAVLTLMGWLLMAPPYHSFELSIDASLSQWKIIQTFETARDCDSARKYAMADAQSRARKGRLYFESKSHQPITSFSEIFRCVATDDRRLAK